MEKRKQIATFVTMMLLALTVLLNFLDVAKADWFSGNISYGNEGMYCSLVDQNDCHFVSVDKVSVKNAFFPECPGYIMFDNVNFALIEGSCKVSRSKG